MNTADKKPTMTAQEEQAFKKGVALGMVITAVAASIAVGLAIYRHTPSHEHPAVKAVPEVDGSGGALQRARLSPVAPDQAAVKRASNNRASL